MVKRGRKIDQVIEEQQSQSTYNSRPNTSNESSQLQTQDIRILEELWKGSNQI